jgi:hypothetical protein
MVADCHVCSSLSASVNITFEALQVESSIVSKQYDNLRRLLVELQQQCSAERDESLSLDVPCSMFFDSMSKGQFQVNFDGMHHLIQGIDVDAAELYTALDPESKKCAIVACATLYLHSMNGMVTVLGGRQAAGRESQPPLLACRESSSKLRRWSLCHWSPATRRS